MAKKKENLTEKRFSSKLFNHESYCYDERTKEVLTGLIKEKVGYIGMATEPCQSPIEKLLLTVLLWDSFDHREYHKLETLNIRRQERISAEGRSYIADIFVEAQTENKTHTIVVECDGHDYHERTKEQAAHDKERDRIINRAGHEVMRFTGSEIYTDPVRCAKEVWKTLETLL